MHFAIIAPPLRGHYAPLSNLAAGLIARGHQATFVHTEEGRPLVDAEGAEFAAINANQATWASDMTRMRGFFGIGALTAKMERSTNLVCREAPEILRALKVDAVIADQMEPAGALVADHLGLPWITAGVTLPMNREAGVPPPFVSWRYDPSERGRGRNRGGWAVSDLLLRSYGRSIAANAKMLGLRPRYGIDDCLSPILQISQLVSTLDFPRSDLPAQFHYCGPLRRESSETQELPPSHGRPTVYCSLGSLQGGRADVLRKVASACEIAGMRLILTHAGQAGAQLVKELEGAALVFDWVPQQNVLQQVDLVICHGGMNTVLDSLWCRLPLIVMPLAFEQPGVAARIEQSGAGLISRAHASAASLARSLQRLRDEQSFASNAELLSRKLRAAGGVPYAVSLIEKTLGAGVRPEVATKGREAPDDARGGIRSGSKSSETPAS